MLQSNRRVLSVIPGGAEGPAMIFAKRQAQSLGKQGLMVRSFFMGSPDSLLAWLRAFSAFSQEVKKFQPHLIHAHFGRRTAFFCLLATRLPLVITYRGSDLNPYPYDSKIKYISGHLFSQLAALRAAGIICVSRQLKERLWWRQNRAVVIPSGVDTNLFAPLDKKVARKELGWAETGPVVLFNAGNHPQIKRLDLAQAAIEEARASLGKIRFEVLRGQVEPALIPTMMNAADCLLVTSDYEGSPTVVQEAMACNLPIVSVKVGDVPERLAKDHRSRIVRRDPEEIGLILVEILQKGERSHGRELVQDCSYDTINPQIISVYFEAMKKYAH